MANEDDTNSQVSADGVAVLVLHGEADHVGLNHHSWVCKSGKLRFHRGGRPCFQAAPSVILWGAATSHTTLRSRVGGRASAAWLLWDCRLCGQVSFWGISPLHENVFIFPLTIRYKDQLVLIDWKTAEKEKNRVEDLYDNPLQVIF